VVFATTQMLATLTTTGMASLGGTTVLIVEQKDGNAPAEPNSCTFGVTTGHDTGNADTSLIYMGQDPTRLVGGRRVQADSFVQVTGFAVSTSAPNMSAAIFDYANAKLTFMQKGVIQSRQSAFQAAGNTSANSPYSIAVGGFAQESGLTQARAINGQIAEVLVWFSALTYLANKWKL
jgi:hypothetical protein